MKIIIINQVYNTFIILLCCYTTAIQTKEIYDIKADDLMDSVLPKLNLVEFWKNRNQHTQLRVPYETTTNISKYSAISKVLTESELNYIEKDARNLSVAAFNLRKRKLDIKTLLETNIGAIQNVHNVDEINVQTKRFNYIQNSTSGSGGDGGGDGGGEGGGGGGNILRRYFPNYDDPIYAGFNYKIRYRVLQLMAQFIYQTKYHLPYAQLLRKKYINHIKYRIGYCYALLRNLKRQQMVIYSTLQNYIEEFVTLYVHLKLYEKVVKLDVDIKDLMVFINKLNDIREKNEKNTKN